MKVQPLLAMLALPLAISSVYAEDISSAPTISISGFGTAAYTFSDTDDAEFVRPNQLNGVKKKPKAGPDSNFGIQATAKFNDMFSVTGQGLVRKIVVDEFVGEIAWAFAKAKFSDQWSVRAGRIGLPVYMISDYRNVGYANTMLRPPVEMYSQVPLESVDGLDVVYQKSFGDTSITAQLAIGQTSVKSKSQYTVDATKLTSIHLVAENGPFTLRFGRTDTTLNIEDSASVNAVVGGLRKFGANPALDAAFGLNAAANNIEVKDTHGSFTSLGLGVDWKNFIVQAEYGKRDTDSLSVADTSSWYTMFGYRIGKFLPYFNHASVKQDSPRTVASLPTTGPLPLPPLQQAQLLGLSAGANALTSQAPIQTSNSIGLRWDFYKSAALKIQIDRFSPEEGPGNFVNAKPTFKGPVNVYAVAIDFVF
ncbi:hypothetical protein [Undibacterium sp. Ren11W]|uniref:hypothetical protein n=1 Tax=Undibacterium sp. Ren11W TaxID=3413045 RepID=UPI003BF0D895